MTRILYGLSGEGSGHSSRSRQMARHLEYLGHDVRLASYDRGYRNLKDDFNVFEIEGLTIASSDNKVSNIRTVTQNVKRLKRGWQRLRALKQEIFKEFLIEFLFNFPLEIKENAPGENVPGEFQNIVFWISNFIPIGK